MLILMKLYPTQNTLTTTKIIPIFQLKKEECRCHEYKSEFVSKSTRYDSVPLPSLDTISDELNLDQMTNSRALLQFDGGCNFVASAIRLHTEIWIL